MTEERLEELIERGGTVYDTVRDELIRLNKKTCRAVKSYPSKIVDELEIMRGWDDFEYHSIANLTDDIEKVKWKRKTYAERTERFEPPMWEEIKESYKFNFIKDNSLITLSLEKSKWLLVDCQDKCYYSEFGFKVTKENYEKACEIVRDLFKGESNG